MGWKAPAARRRLTPTSLDFQADRHITRWHPLVQSLLAVPPPFNFEASSDDDRVEPQTALRLSYPEHLA